MNTHEEKVALYRSYNQIEDIASDDGNLMLKEENGKYYWRMDNWYLSIEDIDKWDWYGIDKDLYDALLKYKLTRDNK